MPPQAPAAVVITLLAAALVTGLLAARTIAAGRRDRRERQAARSALAELGQDWLDPLTDTIVTLTNAQQENTRQVRELAAGVEAIQERLDELGRRFLAVRNEIRRLEDEALQSRYRERLGLRTNGLLRGLVSAANPLAADHTLTCAPPAPSTYRPPC